MEGNTVGDSFWNEAKRKALASTLVEKASDKIFIFRKEAGDFNTIKDGGKQWE